MEDLCISIGALIDKNLGSKLIEGLIKTVKYINVVNLQNIYLELSSILNIFSQITKGLQSQMFCHFTEILRFIRLFTKEDLKAVKSFDYFSKFNTISKDQFKMIFKKFQVF